MRRKFIISSFFSLWSVLLYSQQSSIITEIDSVDYLTPQEYAMMLDRNDRFLIRADILSAGFEWEFINSFSVKVQGGFESLIAEKPFVNVELRYYLPFKFIERSNLNGAYISAGAEYNSSFLLSYYQIYGSMIYTKAGLQRRFMGNGLADLGLRLGYQTENNSSYQEVLPWLNSQESFVIESTASIGLGLTFNKNQPLDYDRLCPVLKCHKRERFLVKLNLANAIRLEFNDDVFRSRIEPSIAVEQKFGNLPFSAQLKVSLDQRIGREREGSYQNSTFLNLGLEGRYYYNLNSRIKNGKSGNGLSANYFSIGYSDQNRWYPKNEINYRFSGREFYYATTGIQRTFGDKLYFDFYVGAGYFRAGDFEANAIEYIGTVECGFKF